MVIALNHMSFAASAVLILKSLFSVMAVSADVPFTTSREIAQGLADSASLRVEPSPELGGQAIVVTSTEELKKMASTVPDAIQPVLMESVLGTSSYFVISITDSLGKDDAKTSLTVATDDIIAVGSGGRVYRYPNAATKLFERLRTITSIR